MTRTGSNGRFIFALCGIGMSGLALAGGDISKGGLPIPVDSVYYFQSLSGTQTWTMSEDKTVTGKDVCIISIPRESDASAVVMDFSADQKTLTLNLSGKVYTNGDSQKGGGVVMLKGGTWDLGGSPLYFGSPTAGLPNNQILHTIDGVAITNVGLAQLCQMRNGEVTFANGSSLSANEDCYGFYINNSGQKNATGNKIVFVGGSTISCAKNFYGDHDNEQLTVGEAGARFGNDILLTGEGTKFTVSSRFELSRRMSGTSFRIDNGAEVAVGGNFIMGQKQGMGRYGLMSVSNGSKWTNKNSSLYIGHAVGSDGQTVSVSAQSVADFGSQTLYIGDVSSSNVFCVSDSDLSVGTVQVGASGTRGNTLVLGGKGDMKVSSISMLGDGSTVVFSNCTFTKSDWVFRPFNTTIADVGSPDTQVRLQNGAKVKFNYLQTGYTGYTHVHGTKVSVCGGSELQLANEYNQSGVDQSLVLDNGSIVAGSKIGLGQGADTSGLQITIKGAAPKLVSSTKVLIGKAKLTFDFADFTAGEPIIQSTDEAQIDATCDISFLNLDKVAKFGKLTLMTSANKKCTFLGCIADSGEALKAFNRTLPRGCRVSIAPDRSCVTLQTASPGLAVVVR